ncbi:MAG: leucine-rich repeat protein [Clostridia bacterium]|nr:leucine-rich repeat protein [Clostridia bacterium]
MKNKDKLKILIILGIEFIAISLILVMIFFAGKKTHTVTFDLNGGILLSGELEQRITQGHNATPPSVTKDGHYLRGWSGSYKEITHDVTIKAIWEYETSPGIVYSTSAEGIDANYCEIIDAYPGISGDVYVGAYHNEKIVFGIADGAFKGCERITAIYMLDGILDIGNRAFEGCTEMTAISLPSTARTLGAYALAGCDKLEELVLPDDLEYIGDYAFKGLKSITEIIIPEGVKVIPAGAFEDCESLTKVTLPEGLEKIEAGAFRGCTALTEIHIPESVTDIGYSAFTTPEIKITTPIKETERPAGWTLGFCPTDAEFVWEHIPEPEPAPEPEEPDGSGIQGGFWQ